MYGVPVFVRLNDPAVFPGDAMKYVYLVLNWFFTLFFLLFTTSMIIMGNVPAAIPLVGGALLLLPPVRNLVHRKTGRTLSPLLRVLSATVLFVVFAVVLLFGGGPQASIYHSPEAERQLMEIYDARLAQWPVPHESRFINTSVGRAHVIISGAEDAPPLLLLHAGGLSAWSWLYNIEAFSRTHRTYAIDTMGEAGKSVLADLNTYPRTGVEVAAFYGEICDSLGIAAADIVGASYGGFIGTNMAIHTPDRVRSLSLLGPMGLTPSTGSTVARIMLVTFFPVQPLQEHVTSWALGDSPVVSERCGEWFQLVMDGVLPKEAAPQAFTPEELQRVGVPTLLVLGRNDNLTGNPEAVRQLAGNVPGIRIEVIDTGHAMGVERPDIINPLVTGFLEEVR